MADVKISALPLASTPLAGTEVLPIVQSATTDQVSVANLTAGRAVSAASLTLTTTPLAVGSGGTGVTTSTGSGAVVLGTTPTFTTSALFPAGTVSAPGISVSGDTNTGIYFPAADTIGFVEGGVEAMRITSAGRVGIGTTTPGFTLDVTGTGNVSGNFTVGKTSGGSSGTSVFNLYFTNTTAWSANTTPAYNFIQNDGSGNNEAALTQYYVQYGDGTAGGVKIGAVASSSFSGDFVVANRNNGTYQENLRVTASGNLGLGVTPSAASVGTFVKNFEIGAVGNTVRGDGSSNITVASNAYNSSGWKYAWTGVLASRYDQQDGLHKWFTAASGTAGGTISFTQAMTLDASGNLALSKIAFNSDSPFYTGANISSGSNALGIGTTGSTNVGFFTNNTERMRIDANGNIICGTAAIATNATNGFLYVPGCAGTPTGTPTTVTGRSPIVVDTTNNKLYFYSGGQWRDAGP